MNKKQKGKGTVLIFRRGDFSVYGLEIGCWESLKEHGTVRRDPDGTEEVSVWIKPYLGLSRLEK